MPAQRSTKRSPHSDVLIQAELHEFVAGQVERYRQHLSEKLENLHRAGETIVINVLKYKRSRELDEQRDGNAQRKKRKTSHSDRGKNTVSTALQLLESAPIDQIRQSLTQYEAAGVTNISSVPPVAPVTQNTKRVESTTVDSTGDQEKSPGSNETGHPSPGKTNNPSMVALPADASKLPTNTGSISDTSDSDDDTMKLVRSSKRVPLKRSRALVISDSEQEDQQPAGKRVMLGSQESLAVNQKPQGEISTLPEPERHVPALLPLPNAERHSDVQAIFSDQAVKVNAEVNREPVVESTRPLHLLDALNDPVGKPISNAKSNSANTFENDTGVSGGTSKDSNAAANEACGTGADVIDKVAVCSSIGLPPVISGEAHAVSNPQAPKTHDLTVAPSPEAPNPQKVSSEYKHFESSPDAAAFRGSPGIPPGEMAVPGKSREAYMWELSDKRVFGNRQPPESPSLSVRVVARGSAVRSSSRKPGIPTKGPLALSESTRDAVKVGANMPVEEQNNNSGQHSNKRMGPFASSGTVAAPSKANDHIVEGSSPTSFQPVVMDLDATPEPAMHMLPLPLDSDGATANPFLQSPSPPRGQFMASLAGNATVQRRPPGPFMSTPIAGDIPGVKPYDVKDFVSPVPNIAFQTPILASKIPRRSPMVAGAISSAIGREPEEKRLNATLKQPSVLGNARKVEHPALSLVNARPGQQFHSCLPVRQQPYVARPVQNALPEINGPKFALEKQSHPVAPAHRTGSRAAVPLRTQNLSKKTVLPSFSKSKSSTEGTFVPSSVARDAAQPSQVGIPRSKQAFTGAPDVVRQGIKPPGAVVTGNKQRGASVLPSSLAVSQPSLGPRFKSGSRQEPSGATEHQKTSEDFSNQSVQTTKKGNAAQAGARPVLGNQGKAATGAQRIPIKSWIPSKIVKPPSLQSEEGSMQPRKNQVGAKASTSKVQSSREGRPQPLSGTVGSSRAIGKPQPGKAGSSVLPTPAGPLHTRRLPKYNQERLPGTSKAKNHHPERSGTHHSGRPAGPSSVISSTGDKNKRVIATRARPAPAQTVNRSAIPGSSRGEAKSRRPLPGQVNPVSQKPPKSHAVPTSHAQHLQTSSHATVKKAGKSNYKALGKQKVTKAKPGPPPKPVHASTRDLPGTTSGAQRDGPPLVASLGSSVTGAAGIVQPVPATASSSSRVVGQEIDTGNAEQHGGHEVPRTPEQKPLPETSFDFSYYEDLSPSQFPVKAWAQPEELARITAAQRYINPDRIFLGTPKDLCLPPPDLTELFGSATKHLHPPLDSDEQYGVMASKSDVDRYNRALGYE